MTPMWKRILVPAAIVAAIAEGIVIYHQWPSPPLKVCASPELGALMAAAAKAEAQAHASRLQMRNDPDEGATKEVIRLEAASAAAYNEVAQYKRQAQEKQTASGARVGDGACS